MSEERFEIEKVSLEGAGRREISDPQAGNSRGRSYISTDSYDFDDSRRADKSRVDTLEMWRALRRRKWLVIAIVLIVTSAVALCMYKSKSIYEASAVIEIGKEGDKVNVGNLIPSGDLTDSLYIVNIRTKMLGLQSRQLYEDVVADLKLNEYPNFLEVAQGNFIQGAFKAVPGAVTYGKPAEGDLDLPRAVADEAVMQPDGEYARSPEERSQLEPFVNALEANLTIEPIRDTQAIKVSFRHTNSTVAAAVANGIVDRFVNRTFKSKIEQFTNAAAWLDRSTRELKERAERAEKELAAYTREHNIFPTESNRNETLTMLRLAHLHDLATRAETDRMLKRTLYDEVKEGRIAQMPDAFSDPRLIELQQRLNEFETEEAQLRVKYAAKNPRLVALRRQIAVTQGQIDSSRRALEEKLKTDYDRAVQDGQSLDAALEQVKADAIQENQASFRYNLLKQDVDTTRALYTDFLQKTSQANLKVAEQQKSTRVVESAQVPLKPVGPQRNLVTLFGFMISLVIGVGVVFLLEYFDNSIKSIEDVSRYVQLPALGIIPAAGRMSRLFPARKKGKQQSSIDNGSAEESAGPRVARAAHSMLLGDQSPVAEAYRVLRTSVLLSSARSQPKVILVTSSQPGEGKTTTTVNIAISLAQLGESVLIIDADLRTPAVHELLEVNQAPGLSTYLSGDVEIGGLIQKLQIPQLSLLASGPIPPNPVELVSTKKMKEMLRELAERYDHILIDSPPLINLADPLVLSTLVNGVLLVVHGGKSTRDVVLRAREELLSVGAEIFGVVLNNVDLQARGYQAKHYYRYTRGDSKKASA